MDTIKASDHVITDDDVNFLREAIDYWMVHKPKRTRKDRDVFHHLTYVLNRIKTSPIIQTIRYERTKNQWWQQFNHYQSGIQSSMHLITTNDYMH